MTVAISNLAYSSSDNSYIDMDVTGWFDRTFRFTYYAGDHAPLTSVVTPLLQGQVIAPYTPPPSRQSST